MSAQNILSPSLESLLREIIAVNRSWKWVRAQHGADADLAAALRELKSQLQVRMLRAHPERVQLVSDLEATEEPLYSVRLTPPVGSRHDAEHLPVRVAERLLSPDELRQFTRT